MRFSSRMCKDVFKLELVKGTEMYKLRKLRVKYSHSMPKNHISCTSVSNEASGVAPKFFKGG